MTLHEFAIEVKELYQLFDKATNEALNKRLFQKLECLEASEFRAMKTRILDECEHFPRLAKFQALKEWILTKRAPAEKLECQRCMGVGYFGAVCLLPLTYDGDKPALGETFYFRCTCANLPSDKRATYAWREQHLEFYAPEWSRDYFKRIEEAKACTA
jgi:hypothetical protein